MAVVRSLTQASGTRLVAALLVVLLGASACGGGTPDGPGAAASAVPTPSYAVPSHLPSAVAPATGERHRFGPVSLVLPTAFARTSEIGGDSYRLLQFGSTDPIAFVELTRTARVPGAGLADAARYAITNSPIRPTRLDDRVVGGQPVYAVAGANEYTALFYSVGRVVDGALIEVSFSFRDDVEPNHELIEAVLATVEWTA